MSRPQVSHEPCEQKPNTIDQSSPKQKRKRSDGPTNGLSNRTTSTSNNDTDTSKPTAVFTPTGPRNSTTTVALPGSIIGNAKSHDQKTYLAGTLARALAVFCVDEIVVFDDQPPISARTDTDGKRQQGNDNEGYTALSDPAHFLIHLLTYLETPPHLRKTLFGMHANLRTAGTLPSLDMPHHLRATEWCPYREGVTTSATKAGTNVDVGLGDDYLLPGVQIPPKTRVTVRLPQDENAVEAEAVAPSTPREIAGYYWGYSVRRAGSLSAVFTECPFDGGYDVSVGTSERGVAVSSLAKSDLPAYQHLLVVFGGVAGLETAARNDVELNGKGVGAGNVKDLFDFWVNLVPGQGSRTIRTEEAVWLGLMGLDRLIAPEAL
jgi:methyltransferase